MEIAYGTSIDHSYGVLPIQVASQAGMKTTGGVFVYVDSISGERYEYALTDLNDSGEFTFDMIADIIEYFWEDL